MPKSRAKTPFALTPAHEQLLRETTITPDHPGPILRDFQTLLDFIGDAGVESGGQHRLLPIGILCTLNEHMSWPIKVDLDRPQLRSYPNLQGLHLLSRASGLVYVQGQGSKARLVVDPSLLASWTSLNPTEQYFSLLDAWLNRASAEMVGCRSKFYETFLDYAAEVWGWIPEEGRHYSLKERAATNTTLFPDSDRYTLVLMGMFGFLEIEQGKAIAGRAWIPTSFRRRAFGEAMFAALTPRSRRLAALQEVAIELAARLSGEGRKPVPKAPADEDNSASAPTAVDDGHFHYDSFHPIFARYFPTLQNSLTIEGGEPADGLLIFRVSLGREMWRRIATPAQSTLEDLANAIRKSVDFDDDHLWSFRFKNRFGGKVEIRHPEARVEEDEMGADEVEVGQVPIAPGESMVFLYDYGDKWEFTVLLEKIDPPSPRQKIPKVVGKHGPSPEQYPDWDEE